MSRFCTTTYKNLYALNLKKKFFLCVYSSMRAVAVQLQDPILARFECGKRVHKTDPLPRIDPSPSRFDSPALRRPPSSIAAQCGRCQDSISQDGILKKKSSQTTQASHTVQVALMIVNSTVYSIGLPGYSLTKRARQNSHSAPPLPIRDSIRGPHRCASPRTGPTPMLI